MAIAAGNAHSLALKNDGTLVAWGDNSVKQCDWPPWLTNGTVKLIAAGGSQSLASLFNPVVQYQVDAAKDLLLIYNTNSLDSRKVYWYYLTNRPMVEKANSLALTNLSTFNVSREDYTNWIANPIRSWLTNNPTKRPQYWVVFIDVPSRIHSPTNDSLACPGVNPDTSVSFELHSTFTGRARIRCSSAGHRTRRLLPCR
jgi:hypothetical protein